MFSAFAFYRSVDPGGNYSQVYAVSDPTISARNNNVVLTGLTQYFGSIVASVTGTNCNVKIAVPSWLSLSPEYIHSMDMGAAVADLSPKPLLGVIKPRNPRMCNTGEELNVQINSNPSSAGPQVVFVFLSDGSIEPIQNAEIFSAAFTMSLTANAGQWGSGDITFLDTLPAGRFAIVGAQAIQADSLVARIIPRQDQIWRPAFPVMATPETYQHPMFRHGMLGSWMEFSSLALPGFECMPWSNVNNSTVRGILDLVRISDTP